MKIRPVGVKLFHAEGQTDRHDEANSGFSQFCERDYKLVSTNKILSRKGEHTAGVFSVLYSVDTGYEF